jgi:leucyl-tRNA synthetase
LAQKYQELEKKWQRIWQEENVFATKDDFSLKKYYVLEMFPYPSGKLHMGHLRNYAIGDVTARYKRAQGYNVLYPMGWDAFGLPAENAAIQNNTHPAAWTYQNIATMKNEMKALGLSYDWSREIATCGVEYYQHEQKIFLSFLKANLAYRKEAIVNWDPVDNTVLANEQVIDGRGWRSGALVVRKKLNQWFLRITDFAEELLQELPNLTAWPEHVKLMQEKWIGKSIGAKVNFTLVSGENIEVFTTRADTLFGASFIAIAIDHSIAQNLAKNNQALADFLKQASLIGTTEEAIEKAEKLGFNTNLYAKHPFIKDQLLPVYVANFVLMNYGTGAIFGCPAHDVRDMEFAKKYQLPIRQVIKPASAVDAHEAYMGDGVLINSDFLDGLEVAQAKVKAIEKIVALGIGQEQINYRLRDWGISRQRYWGCPIPIIHCPHCKEVPVPDDQLPVNLPDEVDFSKMGNPLANHPTWKHVKCPICDSDAVRETDTFDTFFESSWYFARFCNPKAASVIDKAACEHFLPVDQYIGGIEHAVLHLLYARFFTKALEKCGYFNLKEPFKALLTQGMVCKETLKSQDGNWLYPQEVTTDANGDKVDASGLPVIVGRVEKMSKSKKNVVEPRSIIVKYGADTARLFMLSDSPPERDLEWSDSGVEGSWRFLQRLEKFVVNFADSPLANNQHNGVDKLSKITHKTIFQVSEDLNRFHFNRAIARIRELANAIFEHEQDANVSFAIKSLLQLIAPFAPHLAEELWQVMKCQRILAATPWPIADPVLMIDDVIIMAVQVNGKLRATFEIAKDSAKELLEKVALGMPEVMKFTRDVAIKKIIIVNNKIVNIVI